MRAIRSRFLRVLAVTTLFVACPFALARSADDAADDAARAADQARMAESNRILASMAASNVRLDLLFTMGRWSPATGLESNADHEARIITLVERTRGETDPVVLMQLADKCRVVTKTSVCDREAIARRWIEADTQNQVAWLSLVAVQRARGQVDEARSTFRRAAEASMWRTYERELGQAALAAIPRELPLSTRADASIRVLAFSYLHILPVWQEINQDCKDPALRSACSRVLEVASRDARDALSLRSVYRLSETLELDPLLIEQRQRVIYLVVAGARSRREPAYPFAPLDDADSRLVIGMVDEVLTMGERESGRLALRRAGLSDDAAFQREAAWWTAHNPPPLQSHGERPVTSP